MKKYSRYLATLFLTFLISEISQAACDQTLSTGSNVASAVSSAPNGSTICLNSGSYGAINLWNISRSGFVTIQSASGSGAVMSPQVGNSKFIKFVSMTLSDVLVNNCSTSIHFINSAFTPNKGGLAIDNRGCSVTNQDLLVDGVSFNQVQQAGWEGRLSIAGAKGMIIRNSTFSGISSSGTSGPSDGVQIIGGSSNITVGPNNTFSGILESLCGAVHCDAIQDYGGGPDNKIVGNLFINGDTFIMMPDGSTRYTVTDNVFDGRATSYIDKIQFGSASSPIFRHNTIRKVRVSFDSKTGESASSNLQAQNNILMDGSSWKTENGSGCSNCTFTYNLYDSSSSARGTSNLNGTPTFTGGASPSGLAGYQLTSSSVGYKAGNDGLDMGITSYGSGSTLPPPPPPPPPPPALVAPTNLRVISLAYNQIKLQFDDSNSSEIGFQIQRKMGSSGSYSQIATTASQSYDDNSVAASTQYCYQVKAFDSSSSSAASNEICATTPAQPTTPPANVAPSVSITSPSSGSSFSAGMSIAINASAADSDGSIAKVEFFNGSTKLGEDLSAPYSLTMSSAAAGTYSLIARATDNAGTVANSSAVSITVNAVTQPPPSGTSVTLMTSQVPALLNMNDGVSYEQGMRFTSTSAGKITAIRFYKGSLESGTRTGKIYSSSGAVLATVTFSNLSASGWQQANLATPLSIAANTEYTVSVNTGAGYYVATNQGMASQISNGSLKSVVGSNGVYGPVGSRPTQSWENSNYFRDVVFVADSTTQPPPPSDASAPVASITSPANGSYVSRSTTVTIQASASDDIGVTKVEFYVNGSMKCTDTSAAYSCAWQVPKRAGRTFRIQVKAYDATGKVGNSPIVSVTSK